jgi:oxygen-independent coproporphyrinogen III oxidase
MQPIDDTFASEQMYMWVDTLEKNGWEQYEISNFAKDGQYARHNCSYWQQEPYLGVGPSAHSFDGQSRQYNASNNAKYMQSLKIQKIPCGREILNTPQHLNEYLLTGLRTKWGCKISQLDHYLGESFLQKNQEILQDFSEKKWIFLQDDILLLSPAGKYFADRIASDLFWMD